MKVLILQAATISAAMLVATATTSFAGDSNQPPALPGGHPALSFTAAPVPAWSPPTHWTAGPASTMVVKSFLITNAQGQAAKVAVSAFPGEVGGTFANVNRWRTQIGLPPLEESALGTVTQALTVNGGTATLVDLSNPGDKPVRLLAIIVPRGASTWFYKLAGDPAIVAQEKTGFVNFVQTVNYPQP